LQELLRLGYEAMAAAIAAKVIAAALMIGVRCSRCDRYGHSANRINRGRRGRIFGMDV
jgi:hypothetical protein